MKEENIKTRLGKLVNENKGLVSGPFGSSISQKYFVESGIPVIRGNNLKNPRQKFIDDGFVYITEEKAYQLRNCTTIADDIVFTAVGTLGQIGIIPQKTKFPKYIISNKQIRIRVNREVVDPYYLYYYFSSEKMRKYIILQNRGSSVPLLNLSDIRQLPVILPPLPTQQKIASILSAYDDLIENNNQRIQLLGNMAAEIYKEWFVRLRFPNYQKTTIENGVPKGWEKKRLKDILDFKMGQSPKSKYYNDKKEGLPFHQGVSNFNNRFPTHVIYCTDYRKVADIGNILLSVRAPVGRINIANEKLIIGRGLCAIKHKQNYQSYTYYLLQEIFKHEDSHGNGAVFKAVSKLDLERIKTLIPKENLLIQFEKLVVPIDKQIEILHKKNNLLQQTRDLLLPRLISGKLEV